MQPDTFAMIAIIALIVVAILVLALLLRTWAPMNGDDRPRRGAPPRHDPPEDRR